MALTELAPGAPITMYGVLVGAPRGRSPRARRCRRQRATRRHGAAAGRARSAPVDAPDVAAVGRRTFDGYRRADGRVGHAQLLARGAAGLLREPQRARHAGGVDARTRLRRTGGAPARCAGTRRAVRAGASLGDPCRRSPPAAGARRLFPNVDGVRFLTHEGGCGGTGRIRVPCAG